MRCYCNEDKLTMPFSKDSILQISQSHHACAIVQYNVVGAIPSCCGEHVTLITTTELKETKHRTRHYVAGVCTHAMFDFDYEHAYSPKAEYGNIQLKKNT
jgi:hypothetical protein